MRRALDLAHYLTKDTVSRCFDGDPGDSGGFLRAGMQGLGLRSQRNLDGENIHLVNGLKLRKLLEEQKHKGFSLSNDFDYLFKNIIVR